MRKILVFGNSGSGKSTLAKKLCEADGLAHLDLDTLAWKPSMPPERESLVVSQAAISKFIESNNSWVVEGCYADLLDVVVGYSNEIVFMNLPLEQCIENARSRPWEPHKYESKEAQDNNLAMLIDWIKQYEERNDTFSKAAHKSVYDNFVGVKRMVVRNEA